MFGHNTRSRFRISRDLIFVVIATTIFSLTAAGAHAAGFSFMDSVREFLGIQPTQTGVTAGKASSWPVLPLGTTPTPTPTCVAGNWQLAANFPFVGEESAVASDGSFAYAAGGYDGTIRNTMYRYDPSANNWSALANMPMAIDSGRAAYSPTTNSIYVFGGGTVTRPSSNTTYIYNIDTDTWTTGAPMPDVRIWLSVAYYAAGDKFYVIGGTDAGAVPQEFGTVWEYDPVTNTWDTSRLTAPVVFTGGSVGIIGQYIYIAGGFGVAGSGLTNHYRYDIGNNTWISLAPLPFGIFNAVGASVDGRNYVIGGGNPFYGQDASFSSTLIYDPATNAWASGPMTNVAHSYAGGTAIGNRLIIVGGFNGMENINTVETITIAVGCPTPTATATATATPTYTATSTPTSTATPTQSPTCAPGNWTLAADFPFIIADTNVASNGSSAYAAGGIDASGGGAFLNTMFRYDPGTDNWSPLANMPLAMARGRAGYSPVTNSVYVFGGGTQGTPNLDTTFVYNVSTNTWTTGAPMPAGRNRLHVAYYADNNKFYVIGGVVSSGTGEAEQDQVWEYDPVTNTWDTSRQSAPIGIGAGAVAINGQFIYISGSYGIGGGGTTNHYRYDILNNNWISRAPLPFPIFNPVGASVGGHNYVIGGGDPVSSLSSTLIYDPATNAWTNGPSTNVAHSFAAGTAIGNRLIVIGGYNEVGNATNIVEINSFGVGCPTPTPTPTSTPTNTPTASPTPTVFPTPTPSASSDPTPTPSGIFRNSTPICMTLDSAAAPYPSTITVVGGTTIIGEVRVTFFDLYHVFPDNIDALLVGPGGQEYLLMADAGGAIPIDPSAPVTLTFTDYQPNVLPDSGPLVTGVYDPTTWEAGQSNFPPPAPPGAYVEPGNQPNRPVGLTMFGNFGLTDSNGVWSLYVRDDAGAFTQQVITGCINGGWQLEFMPFTAAGISLSGRVTTADGRGIRNARLVISGNSLPEARTVTTGSFGYFSFDGLTAGQTYVVTVNSQRYTFSVPSRVITLVDNVVDADFVADQ